MLALWRLERGGRLDNSLAERMAVQITSAFADMLEKLFDRLVARLDAGRAEKELWDARDIGYHMSVGHRQVLERYSPLPDFPKSIRVPVVGGGRGQPLWEPVEIRKWWKKYKAVN